MNEQRNYLEEAEGHLTRLDSIKARLLILDAWGEAIEEEIKTSVGGIVRRLELELKAEREGNVVKK